MSNSLQAKFLHGLYSPWNSPGQNTGVGSCSLLQGIFPTQGSNPGLPHCRWILYQLSHKWSPRILEWIAQPFFSGSSQPRNQTRVSCIVGGFFTNWAIREALIELRECWNQKEGWPVAMAGCTYQRHNMRAGRDRKEIKGKLECSQRYWVGQRKAENCSGWTVGRWNLRHLSCTGVGFW